MLRWLPCAVALFVAPASVFADDVKPPGSVAPVSVEETLGRMTAAYDGVKAIKAAFTQTTTGMSYFEPVVQTGTISLEEPGKMRWDFAAPTSVQWVSDGTTLWILEQADKKATVFTSVSEMLTTYYGFLTGTSDPRETFRVAVATDEKPPIPGAIALKMTPLRPDGSIESLRIFLDPTSRRVAGVAMLTPFGDRTDLVYSLYW